MATAEPVKLKVLAPLRVRDFRVLWAGMTVSLVGDGITLVAIAWQVIQLSNAPTALALIGIAMSIPHIVLLLVGGVVTDRVERRRVMIGADLLRGAALLILGTLSLTGVLQLWHMMITAALYGAGTAFFGPAFDAIVPDLVPEELLPQANSLDQLVRPAAGRLLGPALGGLLIAWLGPGSAFLADAGTFAVSICCLLMIRARPAVWSAERGTSAWSEVKEGFSFVRSRVWLWGTLAAATLAYLLFLGPTEVLVPYIVKNSLHGSAGQLGAILAMGGVGAIGASLLMAQRGMPYRSMTFMYLAWTCSTLMVIGYGLARFPWQLMLACFLFNAFESAGLIVWLTTKQVLVPARLLGRVSSLDWFISVGLVPLSYALTGPVVHLLGVRSTLVGAGSVGAIVTFGALLLPGMRDVEGALTAGEPARALDELEAAV